MAYSQLITLLIFSLLVSIYAYIGWWFTERLMSKNSTAKFLIETTRNERRLFRFQRLLNCKLNVNEQLLFLSELKIEFEESKRVQH